MTRSAAKPVRKGSLIQRISEVYAQIFHTYRAWWMYILPLAAILLIPLDVLDSVAERGIESLGADGWLESVLMTTVTGAISSTSLLGQVFIAGAIGLSLTHARNGKPPSVRWMVGHIRFVKLIVVDVLYVIAVLIGLILLIIPGLLALIFFSLVGPVVELEQRNFRGAFARSFQLVRSDFWLVAWVLASAQLIGYLIGEGAAWLTRFILGENTVVDGLAKGASDVILDPLFALAIALLTMRLIGLTPALAHPSDRRT